MESLGAILQAVATQITSGAGIAADDYFPESANPPYVFLFVESLRDDTLAMDSWSASVSVVILVDAQDAKTGQRKLYDYIDPSSSSSVRAALLSDTTFGLAGVDATVGEYRFTGTEEIAAYRYYGGVVPIELIVS